MKKIFNYLTGGAVLVLFILAGQASAQKVLKLRAIGRGEKVRISAGGKSKTIALENDFAGDFTPGGEPPHRFVTLLSIKKGASFYLVARLTSGPAVTAPNAPCGGDAPRTLLLIQTDKNLSVEKMQTEIYASCAFNGAGRELKGRVQVTKTKVSLAFDEGREKYLLTFDAAAAEKGLQLTER